MTIYQVVYYNHFGERVADFGFYEDKLDAEKRAFDIRLKTAIESGKVHIEEVHVHDSSVKEEKNTRHSGNGYEEKPFSHTYELKRS